jgi:hypothetical protein
MLESIIAVHPVGAPHYARLCRAEYEGMVADGTARSVVFVFSRKAAIFAPLQQRREARRCRDGSGGQSVGRRLTGVSTPEYPSVQCAGGRVGTEGADSRSDKGTADGSGPGVSTPSTNRTADGRDRTRTEVRSCVHDTAESTSGWLHNQPVRRGERKRARDCERCLDHLVPSLKAFPRRVEGDLQRTPPSPPNIAFIRLHTPQSTFQMS